MKEHPGTFVTGIVFALIGLLYLLEAFGVWTVRLDRLWPFLLIAIGATILLGGGVFHDDEDDQDI